MRLFKQRPVSVVCNTCLTTVHHSQSTILCGEAAQLTSLTPFGLSSSTVFCMYVVLYYVLASRKWALICQSEAGIQTWDHLQFRNAIHSLKNSCVYITLHSGGFWQIDFTHPSEVPPPFYVKSLENQKHFSSCLLTYFRCVNTFQK